MIIILAVLLSSFYSRWVFKTPDLFCEKLQFGVFKKNAACLYCLVRIAFQSEDKHEIIWNELVMFNICSKIPSIG